MLKLVRTNQPLHESSDLNRAADRCRRDAKLTDTNVAISDSDRWLKCWKSWVQMSREQRAQTIRRVYYTSLHVLFIKAEPAADPPLSPQRCGSEDGWPMLSTMGRLIHTNTWRSTLYIGSTCKNVLFIEFWVFLKNKTEMILWDQHKNVKHWVKSWWITNKLKTTSFNLSLKVLFIPLKVQHVQEGLVLVLKSKVKLINHQERKKYQLIWKWHFSSWVNQVRAINKLMSI